MWLLIILSKHLFSSKPKILDFYDFLSSIIHLKRMLLDTIYSMAYE